MADDLVAFLRERLAEDEQAARATEPGPWDAYTPPEGVPQPTTIRAGSGRGHEIVAEAWTAEAGDHIVRHSPARVLAEVDAKRRILDLWEGDARYPDYDGGYQSAWEDVLQLLAVPYARHPDYDERWRP